MKSMKKSFAMAVVVGMMAVAGQAMAKEPAPMFEEKKIPTPNYVINGCWLSVENGATMVPIRQILQLKEVKNQIKVYVGGFSVELNGLPLPIIKNNLVEAYGKCVK